MDLRKEKWVLRLFVAGRSWLATSAHANLRRMCEEHLPDRYRIDVIDVEEDPALARQHAVVALPMVVREAPVPIRKVVGDLSDTKRTLFALQIGARPWV